MFAILVMLNREKSGNPGVLPGRLRNGFGKKIAAVSFKWLSNWVQCNKREQ
jgi:hypothetical protein